MQTDFALRLVRLLIVLERRRIDDGLVARWLLLRRPHSGAHKVHFSAGGERPILNR
jgi:hypothetical protein